MSLFTFNFNVREGGEDEITRKLAILMSTQAELATQLRTVTAQIQKISAESSKTLQKVTDLQAVIDSGAAVSPELQAAVDELKAQVQLVDDLVPDAPVSNGSGVTDGSGIVPPANGIIP